MTYMLEEKRRLTTLSITQDDSRPDAQEDDGADEDGNPLLTALKQHAESLLGARHNG